MKYLFFFILTIFAFVSCEDDWIDYTPIDMWSADVDYDDSNAPKHLSVAAVSIQPSKTDKTITLNLIKSMVEKIKTEHDDIQVIVFGELILEWYYDSKTEEEYQRLMAETIPGNATDFVKTIAFENNVNIVFGLTEIDSQTNKLYNSQVLINPNGEIIKYRKRNLNETDIDNGINKGDSFVSVDIDGIKTALFICSDMQSDKITKEMADKNIDVILHSLTSSTDLNEEISYVGLQMNTWIVFANRYGKEGDFDYTGFTQIINPAGTVSKRIEGKNVYVYRKLGIF